MSNDKWEEQVNLEFEDWWCRNFIDCNSAIAFKTQMKHCYLARAKKDKAELLKQKQAYEKLKVAYIGERSVFYETDGKGEHLLEIDAFIRVYSTIPKPKNKIKLIGYVVHDSKGEPYEFREYIEGYKCLNSRMATKVSEREIEVEDA